MQPNLALLPNASTEVHPSFYWGVLHPQQQCHLSRALGHISTDGKGFPEQEHGTSTLGPHFAGGVGLDGRSSQVPTVPLSSCAVQAPITGTYGTARLPLWNKANLGMSFSDHQSASGSSFYPSSPPSSLSNAPLPPSQDLYACMSNGDASNAHPSSISLAAGTMPGSSLLDRTASEVDCMHNHEKLRSNDSASGLNSGLAAPLSPSYNLAKYPQEPYLLPSDLCYSFEDLQIPVGSPMTDHSLVVTQKSLPMAYQSRGSTVPCGWKDNDGIVCGGPVTSDNLANHFAALHGIKNMASSVKIDCRWCPSGLRKQVKRESMLRHLREVHLRCPRPKKEAARSFSYFPSVEFCSNNTLGVHVAGGMRSERCDMLSENPWCLDAHMHSLDVLG
ncbi:hypothetical protein PISMIDRAFT_178147 [Pisolithus microcarpus 441]|uniref:Uncharacterized protein n=1 Tax=Pisolithus microcarpus 441 TaxID=765257 RepID=A0A0C9YXP2_9AGAM|nr:hypothetical protein BKA83DRAFT_178147 [Pisolithus microcarpus]KIK18669.1 hypothetical protein PISMIDRAFT_178147 [Pisolithus microcarpus 441]